MVCPLAAAVLTAAVLTGCGAPKDCEGEGKITTIEKGVLKVGINLNDGSMGYVDESTAKPAGFAPDTAAITEWNKEHYSATKAYADVSSVQDKLGEKAEYTKLAVFGKKGSCLIPAIQNQALSPLIKDGTLSEISKKYLEKDIIIKK